jgi:hypothetical protein
MLPLYSKEVAGCSSGTSKVQELPQGQEKQQEAASQTLGPDADEPNGEPSETDWDDRRKVACESFSQWLGEHFVHSKEEICLGVEHMFAQAQKCKTASALVSAFWTFDKGT